MDKKFQYFDKAELLHENGENYLILIDQERNTSTPIRLHSVTFNGNDHSKWVVDVVDKSGCSFRFRNPFDTKESAEKFTENILLLSKKTGVQRIS
ncbi:hypothetical protein P3G55_20235 [Leptospira sp. 96542]|nr:hypothetical protein [Leptospira sp. 96542]